MIVSKSFSEIDKDQWEKLVLSSPTATFFQTHECYDFYASLSFLRPFVIGVSENDKLVGIICGYIIADGNPVKRFFSRRAIVPGGALLSPDISNVALEKLLKTTQQELSANAIYIEFRNYNDYSAYRPGFESAGFSYVPHLNFHVPTPDVETTLSNLSSSKKRQIKQTLKSGAEIVKAETIQDVKEYYDILDKLYKERVKSPLFPIEFFEKLILMDDADILLIKVENQIIGGITCVYLKDRTVSEWFVCGEDTRADKNIYPSVLATWAGIEYAANHHFDKFDFMGAGKPDESYGVREFKSKFGGSLVEQGRFLYICKPRLYALGKYIVKKMKTSK
jgi:lipid II:glycine glycyltransferase (peptidoglycan interpeptide bridge formation enzyme)